MVAIVVLVSDIDECEIGDNDCIHIGQHCVNTEGSYRCTCVEGFEERDGYCHGKKRWTDTAVVGERERETERKERGKENDRERERESLEYYLPVTREGHVRAKEKG